MNILGFHIHLCPDEIGYAAAVAGAVAASARYGWSWIRSRL